jgi:hypothetical protein
MAFCCGTIWPNSIDRKTPSRPDGWLSHVGPRWKQRHAVPIAAVLYANIRNSCIVPRPFNIILYVLVLPELNNCLFDVLFKLPKTWNHPFICQQVSLVLRNLFQSKCDHKSRDEKLLINEINYATCKILFRKVLFYNVHTYFSYQDTPPSSLCRLARPTR